MPASPRAARGFLGGGFVLDAILALSLVVALHGDSLASTFSYDDPIILSHVLRHAPFRYLVVPEAWQAFNWRGFYPLDLVSFDLQLRAFGLSPVAFHVYQLLAAAAAAVMLARAVRALGGRAAVARGALAVFLLGPILATYTRQMMTRCFLEGTALLLGAVCVLVAALRRGSLPLASSAAGLWLLSALEKEIFVPFLLPLLVAAWLGERRLAMPFAAAAGVYVGYRAWLAPYGLRVYDVNAMSPAGVLSHLAGFPAALSGALFPGSGTLAIAVLALVVSAAAVLTPRSPRAVLLAALAAAAALAPLVLVSEVLSERHVVVVWAGLLLWLAVGLDRRLAERPSRAKAITAGSLAAALAIFVAMAGRGHREQAKSDAAWHDALFRLAFSTARPEDVLVSDPLSVHYPFLAGLNELRHRFGDGRDVPYLVADAAALCRSPFPDGTRYWDVRDRRIHLAPDLRRHVAEEVCPRIRPDGPLRVSLDKTGGLLRWELGPYTSGTWSLLVVDTDKSIGGAATRYDIPSRGGFWLHEEDRTSRLYVQHVSGDGAIVQSPDFVFPLRGDARIRWAR